MRERCQISLPESTRSGENARKKCSPTAMPDPTKRGSSTSSVVPGYVVDSSTTSCPGRRMRATSAAAATMCVMSGSLDLESGVGTRLGRPPHDQALVLNETRQHVIGHVLDGARAATQPLDPVRVGIDADHREARLGERHGQRQPHVPQPDDADDRRACLDSLTELGSDRVHLATVRARPREAAASPRA